VEGGVSGLFEVTIATLGASSGCGWRAVLRVRRVAVNILNKQLWTADKGWSSSLGLGVGLTTPYRKFFLLLRNVSKHLGPGLILWHDLSNAGPQGDKDRWGELNSASSGYGPMAGFCEHGNEPSGSIKKAGYFLTG
jgi:hypothetical protein